MKKTSSKDQVLIGRVGSPSGLRGEVRITLYQQDSTNLKEGKVLLLKHAGKNQPADRAAEKQPADQAAENQPVARSGKSGNKGSELRYRVQRVRYQKDRPVVKLEGIDDRNAAEEIRGLEVCIDAGDLEPLPEGEHYIRNIIGCRVVDVAGSGEYSESEDAGKMAGSGVEYEPEESGLKGREIGVLRDVIQNTAQSILEVETPGGKTVLIPAVDEFLVNIDEQARLIEVKLIPGFIE